jgi:cytochrome c oxidase subunit I
MRRSPVKAVLTPISRPYPSSFRAPKGSKALAYLHTTDHKQIGKLYLVTSFGFFMVAGLMAMLMRAKLARPGLQFLSSEQYDQLLTAPACWCCWRSRC